MKFSIAFVVLLALVGSAVCARRSRKLLAMGMGAPPGIKTPAKSVQTSDDVKDLMLGDVNNQAAMGVPIDPSKIETIQGAGSAIGGTGLGIANPSKEKIDGLQTAPPGIVENAAGPPE